ncbi:hypothetical protein TNCV_1562881 [Trichonephila clavipes]|nr:hypothetical protein TNCV_1562881 [Trichonephila clavipes]
MHSIVIWLDTSVDGIRYVSVLKEVNKRNTWIHDLRARFCKAYGNGLWRTDNTSDCIVQEINVGSTSVFRMVIRYSSLVAILVNVIISCLEVNML